jgi:hypothetical protein
MWRGQRWRRKWRRGWQCCMPYAYWCQSQGAGCGVEPLDCASTDHLPSKHFRSGNFSCAQPHAETVSGRKLQVNVYSRLSDVAIAGVALSSWIESLTKILAWTSLTSSPALCPLARYHQDTCEEQ